MVFPWFFHGFPRVFPGDPPIYGTIQENVDPDHAGHAGHAQPGGRAGETELTGTPVVMAFHGEFMGLLQIIPWLIYG